MYAVVGCRDCGAFWVIEERPESTECPRCGTRHPTDRLKRFVETTDADAAREARGAMLAADAGFEELYDRLASFDRLDAAADAAGPDPDELLAAAGIDPATAADAASRDRSSLGRLEVVQRAIERADPATEAAIVERATDHGLDAETVHEALAALREQGTVVVADGSYRLV
ncbi:DUF5817 domain-containing protein [Halococcoides cellulosivorans]|uniref:Replication protein H n=1 Tax=Halococcoides cellulosivorans TaxID=1679096 RepID=A0A2R4WXJ6_9EURY|nr:DUF5817 domain-containing protein [Halococcoides cellulosivorans]AWB26258.1 replication protein H [Halococcoides cellulosivorans]